jgi:hypothetical protein
MDSLLPFLQGSCIPYNMPVYPGALRIARDPPGIVEARRQQLPRSSLLALRSDLSQAIADMGGMSTPHPRSMFRKATGMLVSPERNSTTRRACSTADVRRRAANQSGRDGTRLCSSNLYFFSK